MTADEFTRILRSPESLDEAGLRRLEQVVADYPYFQAAHLLLLKSLFLQKSFHFSHQLKKSALYLNDRGHLLKWINQHSFERQIDEPSVEFPATPKPEFVHVLPPVYSLDNVPNTGSEIAKQEIIAETPAVSLLNSKMSFADWLKLSKGEKPAVVQTPEQAIKAKELIEKFIKEEPRITKPSKTEFFSPANMAKQSVQDDDLLVSETLARIYTRQGNLPKAISAYRKLSLMFPNKKLYFAALIEDLESKLKDEE